ncbi:Tetratricopeptide repeat protein [Sulfidibacter corallicola]|uniref:Tetratricopeptide repeat protein n=1 Tax=Sulfidibacter corallicola TaxID=2818388 RepID=A0A8A4TSD4_SULCO|nr:tetratricopeptide repeat protein [Sulfidibacter corallicola]QTD52876.1 tetratricopeptide repeat protein [Sulfidibacter corallicola]
MKAKAVFTLVLGVVLLAWGCGSSTAKKKPRLDRAILGEELEFGRKAAEFDLWQEAIFRWEKVKAADPGNHQATNNLAVAYESVGDYQRALDLYKEALELDEDSADIRKNYKRFLSFYKRHQQQLARERRIKARKAAESSVESQEAPVDEGGQ